MGFTRGRGGGSQFVELCAQREGIALRLVERRIASGYLRHCRPVDLLELRLQRCGKLRCPLVFQFAGRRPLMKLVYLRAERAGVTLNLAEGILSLGDLRFRALALGRKLCCEATDLTLSRKQP